MSQDGLARAPGADVDVSPGNYDARMLRELLDGLPVGVANVLPSGQILYANAQFLETLGIPSHREPSGCHLRNFVVGRSWEAMYSALERALQTPVDGDIQVATRGGKPRTIRLSLGTVGAGRHATVRIVATEVTELVEVPETASTLKVWLP